jgi:hypothetical protein
VGYEYHEPYFIMLNKILGIKKKTPHSFVAQCFPVQSIDAKNLIKKIQTLKFEEFIVTTCPITKGGRGSKGGKKRKGFLMPHKAARKQNKLVNQHRTVNNPSIMQYIPEHYINHTKQAKSKRKINKKRKTKRNGTKQGKIATKKVFRKHHLTKKRKQHGKK